MKALESISLGSTLRNKELGDRLNAQAEEVRDATAGRRPMGKWLRRIRGVIGMGLTWAAAWAVVGSMPRWLFGFNTDAPFPIIFGVLGFVAGVIVSGLLMVTEGRRGFDQLTLPRFAAWGALGGVLLSAVFTRAASLGFGDALAIVPTFAVACAVCASGSLALARRARMRELPDTNGRNGGAKLTDYEKRKLH
jgi:FtsH-binding integral membrane protein